MSESSEGGEAESGESMESDLEGEPTESLESLEEALDAEQLENLSEEQLEQLELEALEDPHANLKYKLRPINEVLEEFPEYKQGWTYNEKTGEWSNPRFAEFRHVVICDQEGKPLWDQPQIEERPGAAILPYDIKDGKLRVGLIFQERPMPGQKYFEVPRGQLEPEDVDDPIKGAIRELEEETGIVVNPQDVAVLGINNANTTYFKNQFPIIVVRVPDLDNVQKKNLGDEVENIEWVKPFSYDQLVNLAANGYLTDGITTSVLFHFGIYKPNFYLKNNPQQIVNNYHNTMNQRSIDHLATSYARMVHNVMKPLNRQPLLSL